MNIPAGKRGISRHRGGYGSICDQRYLPARSRHGRTRWLIHGRDNRSHPGRGDSSRDRGGGARAPAQHRGGRVPGPGAAWRPRRPAGRTRGCHRISPGGSGELRPARAPRNRSQARSAAIAPDRSPPSTPRVFPLLADALAHAPRPLVAARFADVLWTARYGETPHEWAQRAVDAYLASVFDEFGHVLEISEGLQRALRITAEIDDHPRRGRGCRRARRTGEPIGRQSRAIVGNFAVDHRVPRRSTVSGPAAGARRAARPRAPLVTATIRGCSSRPSTSRLAWSSPSIVCRYASRQVEAFIPLARSGEGTSATRTTSTPSRFAEQHELTEIAEQLRAELDGRRGLRDPARDFVDRIVGDDDLTAALARFGACLPTEVDPAAPDDARSTRPRSSECRSSGRSQSSSSDESGTGTDP